MGRFTRKPRPLALSTSVQCPDGHILVDMDPECLRCSVIVTTEDVVSYHLHRDRGELENPDSIAGRDEWGATG